MGQACCKRKAMDVSPTCGPRVICDVFVGTIDTGERTFSISSVATPGRIRLVDCQVLKDQGFIRVIEFSEFPTAPYAAISYPWCGVSVESTFPQHAFSVHGAEHADPIGVDTLRHACAAALHRGCPYLWLDRLCIMQDNRGDKDWHIRQMHKVYSSCRVCIVLAGGIQRLTRLDEETSWIHRAWTLQEALAPLQVMVLLAWRLGSGMAQSGGKSKPIHEVIAGESAIAPLPFVLEACLTGSMSFTPATVPSGTEKTFFLEASIFNTPSSKNTFSDKPFWYTQRRACITSAVALKIAMDDVLSTDDDGQNYAVWQCALLRTCSRPVDTVLSIMGLFGVDLDPSLFDRNDRHGATIALAQAILQSGGSASWLGVGYRIAPDRFLSTFPTFPSPRPRGAALVHAGPRGRAQEVSDLVDPVYPIGAALVPLPQGTMDPAGYLTFSAKALRLRLTRSRSGSRGPRRTLTALDGSEWEVRDESNPVTPLEVEDVYADGAGPGGASSRSLPSPLAYAALLGWFSRYSPGMSAARDRENVRVMLLEEHAPGTFHLRSFFALHQSEKAYVLGWAEREFRVGGPEVPRQASAAGSGAAAEERRDSEASDREGLEHWSRYPWTRPVMNGRVD
uniref:DNA helicase (EC) n=1 Tax=Ganoderma boninense TaxID=34458 RepID=A0A5K1K128_9APHY|nr:DNA helicase (EC [Ganoderma boninense]